MLLYLWLVVCPVLAILILQFGKIRFAKWLVAGSAFFILGAYMSEFWAISHFDSVGCTGSVVKVLSCPEYSFLTWVAIWHQLSFFIAMLYFAFILPLVFLTILIFELLERRNAI